MFTLYCYTKRADYETMYPIQFQQTNISKSS